jgi:gliding motility associated protien GldN
MKLNGNIVMSFVVASLLFASPLYAQKKVVKPKVATTKPTTKNGGSSNTDPFGGGATSNQPPTKTPAASNSNPFGGGSSTSNDPFGGGATPKGNQPPQTKPAGGFNSKLPITVQKSAGGDPLSDTIKPSLRNTSAIYSTIKDRNPLAYDDIREDDAIFRQRFWKIIDSRERINAPFIYKEDGGNNLFFAILVRSVLEDSVAAFEHYDFRKQLTNKEVQAKCTGIMDTANSYDLEGNVVGLSVGKKDFPVDSVYKFQLLEETIFDKEAARLVHRIIGIAPMGPAFVGGKVIPGEHFPYFWIYYPDLRKSLSKKQVYNDKNLGARQTWEDYLENHHFSYYIIKSSMDNARDQKLSDYIKDPLFTLLEGEKMKEKVFNYEQGLWAY